jgi:formamidopyrimidine-DNA glycosylase
VLKYSYLKITFIMPELPEVETVLRALKPPIIGNTIAAVKVLSRSLRIPIPKLMHETLSSKSIIDIKRRAKYLLFELSSGLTMVVHLGMTGRITTAPTSYTCIKHDHVIIHLSDKVLVYNDPRRFGMIDIVETHQLMQHKLFASLGPEPLESSFTGKYLAKILKARKLPIKMALMDNKILVGVGNIYASEALFLASISPIRKGGDLSEDECAKLAASIKRVLNDAIASGGSSIRDFVSIENNKGYFQHHFAVYGKGGKPCSVCASVIIKTYQGGRATFFCEACQL